MNEIQKIIQNFDIEFYGKQEKKIDNFLKRHLEGIVVEGKENISRGRKLYVMNHRSHLDYLILGLKLHELKYNPPAFAAGRNLSVIPVLGKYLEKMKAIPIDRGRNDQAYLGNLYKNIEDLVIGGEDLVLFIEGGRSYDGRIQKPRLGLLGAAMSAQEKIKEEIITQPVAISYDWVPESKRFGYLQTARNRIRSNWFYKAIGTFCYYTNDLIALFDYLVMQFGRKSKPTGRAYLSFGEGIPLGDYIEPSFSYKQQKPYRNQMRLQLAEDIIHAIKMAYCSSGTERLAHLIRNARGDNNGSVQKYYELYKAAQIFIEKKIIDKAIIPFNVINKEVLDYYANSYINRKQYTLGYCETLIKDGKIEKGSELLRKAMKQWPDILREGKIAKIFQ